ncbi:MAG: sigma-70 family RNA polymerase sigma factor [Anaerolineaceae bacterium]|nr:sigma-70 family RNA polymerase sigma factor [Anaerolineaceae bacterium]
MEIKTLDYSVLEDGLLMQAIVERQSAALSVLYDRYGRLIFSLAYNVVQDDGLAEEITQDVFVQIWNKASTYQQGQGKVMTWLGSIARHRAIDVLRWRHSRVESRLVDWEDDDLSRLPDGSLIEADQEVNQQRKRLRQAVAQLPPEQRSALALAFFKGYTHQQIADLTGEPLGTVKTRIRLAMQKLRQILENDL